MAGLLQKFRAAKAAEIEELRRLQAEGKLPAPLAAKRPSFSAALKRPGRRPPLAVIAEYKRASPSKGAIELGLSAADAARAYAEAGADALSILTEETYFQGSLSFLAEAVPAGLPLLRKDFLFDPLQLLATAATPASALLLIARMFEGPDELARMLVLAASLGLESVVEVFDEPDLGSARAAGARIIQVNNRDLDTLEVSLAVAERLGQYRREDEVWIAASGLAAGPDLGRMAAAGFDAVLIGTSLMQGGSPGATLARMLAEAAA